MILHADYETRSRCDLSDRGGYEYASHESTSILSLAFAFDDGPVQLWTPPDPPPEALLRALRDPEVEFRAHNAGFERLITKFVGPQYGLPEVPPERFRCSAARARHANIPGSLEDAAAFLGTARKDKEGHAVMLLLSQPNPIGGKRLKLKKIEILDLLPEADPKLLKAQLEELLDKSGRWPTVPEWREEPELYERMYRYNKQDVVAERDLEKALPPLPEFEQQVWLLDRSANEYGLPIDTDFCRGACRIIEAGYAEAQEKITALTYGRITKGTQRARIQEFVNELGVNIENTQKDTVEEVLETNMHKDARTALELLQFVSGAAVGKYRAALKQVSDDGRLREHSIYYGASATGRWTAGGMQPLNMKRGIKLDETLIDVITTGDYGLLRALYQDDPPIGLLGSCVRGIICAPDGKMLVDADSSQIELRIVHWLAGDQSLLNDVRAGFDPYKALYAKNMGVPVMTVTKEQRQQGKIWALGMQYAMGAKALVRAMAKAGKIITIQEAKEIIAKYRKNNPEVAALWDKLTRAAIVAIQRGRPVRCGKLVFEVQGNWLTMKLPSGRRLYYYKPSVAENQYGFPCVMFTSPNKGRISVGGGHFLENAAQAICRDLLCVWMLDLTKRGIQILMNVYDQIVSEVYEDQVQDAIRETEEVMSTAPEWCLDLPLGVGAVAKKRFEKD
jgi:DNA polymerase